MWKHVRRGFLRIGDVGKTPSSSASNGVRADSSVYGWQAKRDRILRRVNDRLPLLPNCADGNDFVYECLVRVYKCSIKDVEFSESTSLVRYWSRMN